MKYLVMECFDSYAVLLDEQGRFVKSANLGYEIGETVVEPVLMRAEPLEDVGVGGSSVISRLPRGLIAGVVTVAAMVALFFGYNYYQNNMAPYTSIFMAINPEVEMVLNKQGEVLNVNGTNPDGVDLIEGYEPSSKNKLDVANELVDRAIALGYLADGGRVSIAIDTPDDALFEEYGIELRRELDGRISITIEITDIEGRNKQSETPATDTKADPEPTPEPETPVTPPADDSDYDDSGYDDSGYNESSSSSSSGSSSKPAATPAATPAPKPAATSKPAATPKPADTTPKSQSKPADDDSDYDDSDYDDSDYDDSDYDDSDYDDSDYDDSDYDD